MKADEFLKEVTDAITEIAKGNLSTRLMITHTETERDVIAAGINMLFEELESMVKLQNTKTKALMNMMEDMEETRQILEENEEKLRCITSSAQDAIVKIDHEGKIDFWNPAAEAIFGYSKREVFGKDIHSLIIPEELMSAAHDGFNEFKKTGKGNAIDNTVQLKGVRKDGEIFPVELSLSAVNIHDQWNAIGIIRDISQRMEMEESIRVSEAKYSALVENSVDGIIVIQNGKLRFVNRAASNILGYGKNEFLGKNFLDFIAPEYQEMAMKNHMDRIEGKDVPSTYELGLVHKNSNIVPIEITAATIEYDGEPGVLVFIRDITERKMIENEIKKLSSQNEAILSSIPDIIMEVNVKKVYTWANKEGYDFFGNDVIGKEASFYFEGDQDTYERIEPILKGDEDVIYIESWQMRKDGEKRLLAWWCKVMKDDGGEVTGIISTARDITEHKKMAMELQTAHEKLEEKVKKLEEFKEITVDRELVMIGLKKSIRILEGKLKSGLLKYPKIT